MLTAHLGREASSFLILCLQWTLSQETSQPWLHPSDQGTENVSQGHGHFFLPHGALSHLLSHLSIQSTTGLGYLKVIIEGNLFFEVFY